MYIYYIYNLKQNINLLLHLQFSSLEMPGPVIWEQFQVKMKKYIF